MKLISFTRKNYVFASPFLIALYTVFFLYSTNQAEFRVQVVIVPIVLALLCAGGVFFVCRFLVERTDKAALISSLIVFICLSYQRFLEMAKNYSISDNAVFSLSLFVFIFFSYFIIIRKKNLFKANMFAVAVSLILLAFPVFNTVSYEVKTGRMLQSEKENSGKKLLVEKVSFQGEKPDIYYIILDRYAGKKALVEQYDFDNSGFLNFLKKKGFYVTENSTTNYPKTFLSLASSLNMEYVDFMTQKTNGGVSSDESLVTSLIRSNKVIKFLKDRGYTYVQVGSWWEPTSSNINADISYTLPKKGYLYADEFTTGFLNTTIAAPFFKAVFHDPIDVSSDPQDNLHRQAGLYAYKVMEEVPLIPGPKFVFTHILLPHDPFVFDEYCFPLSEKQAERYQHQENYVNQVKCVNTKTEKMLEDIFSLSKEKPVIILQADEGPFPMNSPLPNKQSWATAKDQALHEKFPILNAYYFPGGKTSGLYDSITPVNSFRVLLNTYFGENLPLLEDRNYVFKNQTNYYKFTDVTQRVMR